jgi:hypothetical protein
MARWSDRQFVSGRSQTRVSAAGQRVSGFRLPGGKKPKQASANTKTCCRIRPDRSQQGRFQAALFVTEPDFRVTGLDPHGPQQSPQFDTSAIHIGSLEAAIQVSCESAVPAGDSGRAGNPTWSREPSAARVPLLRSRFGNCLRRLPRRRPCSPRKPGLNRWSVS